LGARGAPVGWWRARAARSAQASMEVAVPPGCSAGSPVEFVDAGGRAHTVTVPEGYYEGDTFLVDVEPPPDFLEEIMDALLQSDFMVALNQCMNAECHLFLTAGEGEHTLEQTESHRHYVQLYEEKIEEYLSRFGVSGDQFLGALTASQSHSPDEMVRSSLAASLLAVENFKVFAARCHELAVQRARMEEDDEDDD